VAPVRRILKDIGYDADDLFETSNEMQLTAYVVSDPNTPASHLRSLLKECLPLEMIPSRVMCLDAIPLTTNGKVDVGALPQPEKVVHTQPSVYRAPSSEIEVKLCAIWADILRIERLGVDDNYYELGGDSIAAIRIAARARRSGVELAPALIFQYQTIAQLAAAIGADAETTMALPDNNDPAPFALSGLGAEGLSAIAEALSPSHKTES
ncbi:MAG: phosphopantetheine-binding protein, partial [Pseudomonadota bacterium]